MTFEKIIRLLYVNLLFPFFTGQSIAKIGGGVQESDFGDIQCAQGGHPECEHRVTEDGQHPTHDQRLCSHVYDTGNDADLKGILIIPGWNIVKAVIAFMPCSRSGNNIAR